jgi:hypothetical protein
MAEESSSGLTTAVQLALRAEAAPEVEDDEPVYDLLGFQTSEAPKRANLARAGRDGRGARATTPRNSGSITSAGSMVARSKFSGR